MMSWSSCQYLGTSWRDVAPTFTSDVVVLLRWCGLLFSNNCRHIKWCLFRRGISIMQSRYRRFGCLLIGKLLDLFGEAFEGNHNYREVIQWFLNHWRLNYSFGTLTANFIQTSLTPRWELRVRLFLEILKRSPNLPHNILSWQLIENAITPYQNEIMTLLLYFKVSDFWLRNDHSRVTSEMFNFGMWISECPRNLIIIILENI